MWEYEVAIKTNLENRFFIWGYSFEDACRRNRFHIDDLEVLSQEYVDQNFGTIPEMEWFQISL